MLVGTEDGMLFQFDIHLMEHGEVITRLSPLSLITHPGGNPGANLQFISHRCYLREVAFEWELTEEAIYLPLRCLQGGLWSPLFLITSASSSSHSPLLLFPTRCFFSSSTACSVGSHNLYRSCPGISILHTKLSLSLLGKSCAWGARTGCCSSSISTLWSTTRL